MHDEEIISILLNEYNTLRGEIVARAGHGFQIIGFSVAAYAFLANRAGLNVSFWIGVGLITVVAAFGTWFTIRDTRKAHDRLAEIELYINDLIGEDILVWENLWSSGARGVLGFAKPALLANFRAANRQSAPGAVGRSVRIQINRMLFPRKK